MMRVQLSDSGGFSERGETALVRLPLQKNNSPGGVPARLRIRGRVRVLTLVRV